MSFAKAHDILRLADFATARHRGVTLDDITREFSVSHRTAQRMTDALETLFPHAVEVLEDDDRRRRWCLREIPLARLRLAGDDELAGLELAIERLTLDGDMREAQTLSALKHRLLAALPGRDARRAEADAEAMLEAHGMAARPGPMVHYDPAVAEAVAQSLRGPTLLEFTYRGQRRRVEPYGILLGARRYLVARQPASEPASEPARDPGLRHFRFDLIENAQATTEWFGRDEGFSLRAHAARAFGSYQDDAEYGEVVWRFAAAAAARAREWRFHPLQEVSDTADGGIEVRFRASGWLEMAWHLYQWGTEVEVIAPPELRALVDGHRRADFASLP